MTQTYEFSLFALGAELNESSVVEQLERAGYTHPAAAASEGIQALAFVRAADRLADAVEAAASEAEQIEGVSIAREIRTGAAAAFDSRTLDAIRLRAETASSVTMSPATTRLSRRTDRSQRRRPRISLD